MTSAEIAIIVQAQDRASRQLAAVQGQLQALERTARGAGAGLGFLGNAASTALGFLGGGLIGQAISGVGNLAASFVGANIQMESARIQMEALMTGITRQAGATGEAVGEGIGGGAEDGANRVRDAQERILDEMTDYAERRADIERQITLATGGEISERVAREEEALADMAEAHGRRVGDIRRDIAELQADWQDAIDRRMEGYEREVSAARRPFEAAREANERNVYLAERAIDEETAKGADANQEKIARLRARIDYEQSQRDRSRQAEQQAIDAVKAKQAEQEAHEQRLHDRRLANLQQMLDRENAEYDKQVARRRRDLAEELAQQKAANAERVADLEKQLDKLDKMHERSLRDAQQALEQAGKAYGAAASKSARAAYSEIDRLFQPGGLLAGATTAAQQAGRLMDFIRKEAAATPFTIPQLIDASNRMLVFGMDITRWFRTLGDMAALTGKPMAQVVEAVGTLMTGDIGEAVMRFKDLYVNLRSITGLKWDAQNQLVTPLEKAIPIIEKFLNERFGGGMERMSKTWEGIMSNLDDAWFGFREAVGQPVFDVLKAGLEALYGLVGDNKQAFEAFGRTLGTEVAVQLGSALGVMVELARFFGVLPEGKADEYLRKIGRALYGDDTSIYNAGDRAMRKIDLLMGDLSDNAKINTWMGNMKVAGDSIGQTLDNIRADFNESILTPLGKARVDIEEFWKAFTRWWNDGETQKAVTAIIKFIGWFDATLARLKADWAEFTGKAPPPGPPTSQTPPTTSNMESVGRAILLGGVAPVTAAPGRAGSGWALDYNLLRSAFAAALREAPIVVYLDGQQLGTRAYALAHSPGYMR